jgi:ribosome-binding factor A
MSSRRLEKIERIIRNTVSEVIQNHLSDPRITGLISVTRAQLSADLRQARVYLSIVTTDPTRNQATLQAVKHARGYIQSRLAGNLSLRTCPKLEFFLDDSIKKGFEISHILDQIAAENQQRQENAQSENSNEYPESDDEK